jgi:hypothetical protein
VTPSARVWRVSYSKRRLYPITVRPSTFFMASQHEQSARRLALGLFRSLRDAVKRISLSNCMGTHQLQGGTAGAHLMAGHDPAQYLDALCKYSRRTINPFTLRLVTCLKRTLAGRASEDSSGSDGHESSRRWCHNAGRTPARLACAAQRRRSCCSAAATRLEDPSATSAPCSKKML